MPTVECALGEVTLFCDFLSLAPLLEELELYPAQFDRTASWIGHITEEALHIELADVFSRLTWPSLRQIALSDCAIETGAFIAFMKRHAAKLEVWIFTM